MTVDADIIPYHRFDIHALFSLGTYKAEPFGLCGKFVPHIGPAGLFNHF
jgi:hypothetical protein